MRIEELPHWVFTDLHPAFNDTESLTAIEMVSRVYGKVQELIDEYNKCIDEINKTITDFINSAEQDGEEFKERITKIIHDYIAMIDEKIKMQDETIDNAVAYMTTNLKQAITDKVTEMTEDGSMSATVLQAFENLEPRVTNIETNMSDLSTRMETAESNITALDTRVTTNESSIASANTNISALDTRVATAETNIQDLDDRIYGIEDKVENMPSELPDYVLKNDIAVLTGTVTITSGTGQATVPYPEGFTKSNTVVLSTGCEYTGAGNIGYGVVQGSFVTGAGLADSVIAFMAYSIDDIGPSGDYPFKIVIMKI